MKKPIFRLLALMLAVCLPLFGIGGALAQQTAPTARDMMNLYEKVLQGKLEYIQCNVLDGTQTKALFTTKLTKWYGYDFGTTMKYNTFCVTDLDADSYPELVLRLSDDFGFELLRSENGVVYGFPFVYRAMEDVTLEGDLLGDSGAADSGWYRVRFKAGQMEQAVVCEMRSTDGGEPEHYFIGDQEVAKDDYDAYYAQIEGKARPVWLDFTVKNIKMVVSKF